MDRFELRRAGDGRDRSNYAPREIWINEQPLLDILRPIEAVYVAAEVADRIGDGESEGDLQGLTAASYMYPTAGMLGAPPPRVGEFFGLVDATFGLDAADPAVGKTWVLDCECGNAGCWPWLARIVVETSVVTWSEFAHYHRDWSYNIGPFRFDRAAYEAEFAQYRQRV